MQVATHGEVSVTATVQVTRGGHPVIMLDICVTLDGSMKCKKTFVSTWGHNGESLKDLLSS